MYLWTDELRAKGKRGVGGMTDEYLGVKASLAPHDPEVVASHLRVVADQLEDAPEARKYSLELVVQEYIETVSKQELEEMDYNDLKELAAKRDLDVGMTPSEDELKDALTG